MNQACVSLDEVLAAAGARAASLVPETSGYLTLAVADATSRLPYQHDDRAVLLTVDGSVMVPRKPALVPPVDAARALRDVLRRLLAASTGSMPGLAAAARPRGEELDVDHVIADIEAALIPVNRAAARRALARLARETLRAKQTGKLRKPSQPPAAAPAPAQATTAPLAAAPAPVQAAPVPLAAAPAPVQAAPVPLAAVPAPVQAAPVPPAAAPDPVQAATVPLAAATAPVQAALVPLAAAPAPVQAATVPLAAAPSPFGAATSPAVALAPAAADTPTPAPAAARFSIELPAPPPVLAALPEESATDTDLDATIADPDAMAVFEAHDETATVASTLVAELDALPADLADDEDDALTRPWQPEVAPLAQPPAPPTAAAPAARMETVRLETPTAAASTVFFSEPEATRADELLAAFRAQDQTDAVPAAARGLRELAGIDGTPPPRPASRGAERGAAPLERRAEPPLHDGFDLDLPPPRPLRAARSRWPLAVFVIGVLALFTAWLYRPALAQSFLGLRDLLSPAAAPAAAPEETPPPAQASPSPPAPDSAAPPRSRQAHAADSPQRRRD